MTIDASQFQKLLNEFQLSRLFVNELGWDNPSLRPQSVPVNGYTFTLTHVANKRGVAVFMCSPDALGSVPPRATLLKIEKEATKLSYEHLLIFADATQKVMTWLWVARVPGQPAATRTHTWHKGTSGEALRQKLNQIVWSLEEEEAITLTDVIKGLRSAFDRDRVSKRFYDHFKTEHQAFSDFIEGIDAETDQAWYASLMLNRLMFVYFIQQKGFLDGNPNYLSDRMEAVRQQAGKGKFHTFYRQFLRRLFHEGLGQHKKSRVTDLSKLIGDVPYLNGGLFDVHELEIAHPDIDIPDDAFKRLFTFFDAYDWHLDDRPLSSGSEINPDVLGYIFEKYINQKQMGAYYTKEDITEYISKNTVIPHLLDQARERCKVAFEGDLSVWSLLKTDPDRYIYPAMKTGVIDPNGQLVPVALLPDFVQTGMNDPKARMFERRYNLGEAVFHITSSNGQTQRGTLPTETWREYVDRRSRCIDVRDKLTNGEVQSADDLVTLNLDIRQFMQDVIDNCTSPDLLRAIWQSIVGRVPERANEKFRHGITILDPTCGSGAFLFAALNVLEPLYEACLDRMEGFVEDAKKLGKPGESDFIKVLEEVGHHHSRSYFIYKNIILHNLFGVDIMAEAVEICKLRLFLKLVSQVDAGRELEPLPDIDFNIRAGNTLVGYATEAQFDAANTLASDQSHRDEIKASTADLADAFDFFRQQQTVHGGKVTADDKRKLRDKLNGLSLELDRYLAQDYGIDLDKKEAFAAWRASHQPFHWFAEFYGVIREGGFDVVIGNPPYVATRKLAYTLIGTFSCEGCGDIFATCTERSYEVLKDGGRVGLIIPLSATSTDSMLPLKDYIKTKSKSAWVSYYSASDQPASLFSGVRHRLMILLAEKDNFGLSALFATRFIKWFSSERENLFNSFVTYAPTLNCGINPFSKTSSIAEVNLLAKLANTTPLANSVVRSGAPIYYHNAPVHWGKVFDFVPHFQVGNALPQQSSHVKTLNFVTQNSVDFAICLLNSSLFYWFNWQYSNCRDLSKKDILRAPSNFDKALKKTCFELQLSSKKLMNDFSVRKKLYSRVTNNVRTEFDSFYPAKSKAILDEIDQILGRHFNMSPFEIDMIINYDLKYRIGASGETEDLDEEG
jgi:type I restriction-modification system DNA methylase subunit